jgi:phospho-N-acetylmuramoyl-pentapeptide-transferase
VGKPEESLRLGCARRDARSGLIGFYDDYLKISKQTHAGFSGRTRLIVETVIGVAACTALMQLGRRLDRDVAGVPFFKELVFNLGWAFVLVGRSSSSAPGMPSTRQTGSTVWRFVPVMIAAAASASFPIRGNAVFAAEYLQIHYVPGTGELASCAER